MMKIFSIISVLTLICIKTASAAAPTLIGDYGDWSAYFYKDAGGLVCYMASTPKKEEGKYTQRGDVYVVITHRPKDKSFDVVNFEAGYTYKQGSKIEVKIGTSTYNKLFSEGSKAWSVNDGADKELVNAMKKGDRMIIHGTSAKNTNTKDTYSLKGFSGAYKAVSGKCGKK